MEAYIRYEHRAAPFASTVRGTESPDLRAVEVRHNDGAIWLYDRLTTQAVEAARGFFVAPAETAIAGGAHVQRVAQAVIVPLGIAIPIEGTAGGVVTGDPVLVHIPVPASCHDGHRVGPGGAAV